MGLKTSLLLFVALGLAAIMLFGCVSAPSAAPSASSSPSGAQLANPASVNCGNVGGSTDIRTDASGGQYGMCVFANGTECEEWALFRGEGCKPAQVSEAESIASGEIADINNLSSDLDSIENMTSGVEVDLNVPNVT